MYGPHQTLGFTAQRSLLDTSTHDLGGLHWNDKCLLMLVALVQTLIGTATMPDFTRLNGWICWDGAGLTRSRCVPSKHVTGLADRDARQAVQAQQGHWPLDNVVSSGSPRSLARS